MKKILLSLFLYCLSANINAQNLVRPTGFELSVSPWYKRGIGVDVPILNGFRIHLGNGKVGEPMFGINAESVYGTKPGYTYSKNTFEAEGGGVIQFPKNKNTWLRLTGFLGFNSWVLSMPNPDASRNWQFPRTITINESNAHGGLRADLSHYIFIVKPTEDNPRNFYIAPTIGAVCQFQPVFDKLYDRFLTGLNLSTIISFQPKNTNFTVIPAYGLGLYNQGWNVTFGIGYDLTSK
jgi:hypothetical protein